MKTMRTMVDLDDSQIQALDELLKKDKRSLAALIFARQLMIVSPGLQYHSGQKYRFGP
jgi:hypothetical protein